MSDGKPASFPFNEDYRDDLISNLFHRVSEPCEKKALQVGTTWASLADMDPSWGPRGMLHRIALRTISKPITTLHAAS